MAKIVVQKIKEEGKTNKGTAFWMCLGTIDGELDEFKVWDAPELGVEFEGEVKDNGKYGKSISTGRGGNGGGGGGRRFEREPEIGNQIMRQNALEHATAVMLKVADLSFEAAEDKKKAFEDAKDKLKPINIIKVADWFFRYSNGTLSTGASTSAPSAPASTPQVPITDKDVQTTFPEAADQQDDPTPPKGQDIDPKDLPF